MVPHINQEASGPSYSVPRLCQSLAACDNQVELTCLAANGLVPGVVLDIHPQWPVANRFAISTSLTLSLSRKACLVDVVHNHSLWSMVNVAAGLVVPGKRAALVASPRGTLSDWALRRSGAVKRILWPLQRQVLLRADLLHATSEVERQEIRAQGFTAPVVVLSNGIDLPIMPPAKSIASEDQRTLLYLSRIHPIKGLDRLLQAWKLLQTSHPRWRLQIVGTGEPAHVLAVQRIADKLGVQRVLFSGPLYAAAKSQAYFASDLFVLPTHSENFGMVVAEALAHGCPAIVSRGAPWSAMEKMQCGWWIENDVQTLISTLDIAMRLSRQQLTEMGLRGRAWMERDFGWTAIGKQMSEAYRWILAGKIPTTRPSYVFVD